jgi:hypothetical protein
MMGRGKPPNALRAKGIEKEEEEEEEEEVFPTSAHSISVRCFNIITPSAFRSPKRCLPFRHCY